MKKILIGFFLCCLMLTNSTVANATLSLQETGDGVILDVKTGSPTSIFSIPNEYINKDNSLKLPLEVSLTKIGKPTIALAPSDNLVVVLPDELQGIYTLEAKIGDYTFIKDVAF